MSKQDQVTKSEDGSTVTIKLKTPVKTKTGEVAELVLRTDCTVADLEVMDGADGLVGKTKLLCVALSVLDNKPGIGMGILRKMKSPDWMIVAEQVAAIMNGEDDGAESDDEQENDGGGKASPQTGGSS